MRADSQAVLIIMLVITLKGPSCLGQASTAQGLAQAQGAVQFQYQHPKREIKKHKHDDEYYYLITNPKSRSNRILLAQI